MGLPVQLQLSSTVPSRSIAATTTSPAATGTATARACRGSGRLRKRFHQGPSPGRLPGADLAEVDEPAVKDLHHGP